MNKKFKRSLSENTKQKMTPDIVKSTTTAISHKAESGTINTKKEV